MAATGDEKEMVSQSTVVRVAKEEKSTEAGTRGMEPKICTGDGGGGERRRPSAELQEDGRGKWEKKGRAVANGVEDKTAS